MRLKFEFGPLELHVYIHNNSKEPDPALVEQIKRLQAQVDAQTAKMQDAVNAEKTGS